MSEKDYKTNCKAICCKETCKEYLGCTVYDCVMNKTKNTEIPCWEMEHTLCNNPALPHLKKMYCNMPKSEACAHGCIYYKYAHEEDTSYPV